MKRCTGKAMFTQLAKKGLQVKPVFWRCGGGPLPYKWAYGYWTGPGSDLLCIKPDIKIGEEAERHLSPICDTKLEAKKAFLRRRRLKR